MTHKQETCRACGSKALTAAFSLGGENHWVFCDREKDPTACGLLQRSFDVAQPSVREKTITRTMRHRLRAATTQLMEMMTARDAAALDLGCGEGTLLSYLPRWIDCIGLDEHFEAGEQKWGRRLAGSLEDPDAVDRLIDENDGDRYDLITATGMLGASQAPSGLLQDIKSLLASDGIFMLETPYLPLALMRDNPYPFNSAAKSVFSLEVLESLARRNGLKIVRGTMTESEGGSLRLFLTHADFHGLDDVVWLEQLARLWDEEKALGLQARQPYQTFAWRMERNRQEVRQWAETAQKAGETAWLLGVSPGMLTTLDWFGIDGELISGIVTRDEALDGSYIRLGEGPSIDIFREEEDGGVMPDYIIVPACHRREALEHWREGVFDGVRLVFLTPDLQMIDDVTYGTELGKALAVTDGPGSVDTLRAVLAGVRRPQLVSVSADAKKA